MEVPLEGAAPTQPSPTWPSVIGWKVLKMLTSVAGYIDYANLLSNAIPGFDCERRATPHMPVIYRRPLSIRRRTHRLSTLAGLWSEENADSERGEQSFREGCC